MSFPEFPNSARLRGLRHKDPSLPAPYLSHPRWTAAGRSSGRRRRRRCRFGSGRGDRARTRWAAMLSRCSLASQPSSTGSRDGQGGEKRRERSGEGGDRESLQRKSRPSLPTAPPGRRRRFWVSGNINFVFAQEQSKAGGWVRGCSHPPGCLHAPAIAISRGKKKKKKRESVKKSRATHTTTSVLCNRVPSPPQSRKVAQGIASLREEPRERRVKYPPQHLPPHLS